MTITAARFEAMRVIVALAATATVAHAQPIPCEPCARGDKHLDTLGETGEVLRGHALELAGTHRFRIESRNITEPEEQELQRWLEGLAPELRAAVQSLGAWSDGELLEIGHALCGRPDQSCAMSLAAVLRCASRGCTVQRVELVRAPPPHTCDPTVGRRYSSRFGLGFDAGSGWQASAHPVDGLAWSLGGEARVSLGDRKLGLVARLDRSTGRDEGRDEDGDGRDDVETGPVTRLTALAGPSFVPLRTLDPELVRYLQVDVLAGYLSSRSQPGTSGPAAALDLSFQLASKRVGLRIVQGFGDAKDERAVIAHLGLTTGAGPEFDYGAGCSNMSFRPEGSALALALDVPFSGWSQGAGYTAGIGVEGALHLRRRLDALLRGDLLASGREGRDFSLHQSLLAGVRFVASRPRGDVGKRKGVFGAALAGYTLAAAPSSSPVRSGPVVDLALGLYGGGTSDASAYVALHGRLGISPESSDLRAVFLSAGGEWRLDRRRWKDRD